MTPGLEREDGQLRIRVMKGLVLSPLQLLGVLVGIGILFALPDIARSTENLPIRERPIYRGMVLGLAAVGLNLLLRHADLVSFGHAAFFGTGAYTVAILIQFYQIQSVLVLIPMAIIAATLVAVLIGYFTLPHEGLYFALVTLAFGQLLFSIPRGIGELGGSDGLNALAPSQPGMSVLERFPRLGSIALTGSDLENSILFLLTITVSLVLLLVMLRISKSPFGRALDAIGQQRTRARFLGLPVKRYVWAAFIISGFYGGVAGSLYAIFFTSGVSPDQTLQVFVSGDILYIAILGGFNTLTGPFIGGIIFEVLANIASDFELTGPGGTKEIGRLITGIVLLIIVFVFPSGVVGSLKRGGKVREAGVDLKNDPSLIGPWLSKAASGSVDAVKRAAKNVRILLLGVK
ncbi:branched-chain amino acid ABC transporter permease [Salinibaculum salinum]|uniref:branched-chain amino acid ABC transporter permease n=1 Tax=Salinibaculum salinum TaxID=3131996 RepID=UPI0030EC4BA5